MSKYTKPTQDTINESLSDLRKLIKCGDEIYLIVRHVSKSGMSRVIDPIIIRKGQPLFIRWDVAAVTGLKLDRDHEGIKVDGVGMDMGFWLVHEIGRALFPNGFRLRKGQWHNKLKPGQMVRDGGYALKHRWL